MVHVDYVAVVIAAVISMALGMMWYSPYLFGKVWQKLAKLSKKDIEESQKNSTKSLLIGFLNGLLVAYVLALVIHYTGLTTLMGGIMVADLIWLGFVATTILNTHLGERKPVKLFLLNSVYHLLAILVMGGIIGYMM